MRKKIYLLLFILMTLFIITGCSNNKAADSSKIYATVNGEPITLEEFNLRVQKMKVVYNAQGRSISEQDLNWDVLDSLVREKIVAQAAKKKGINVPVKKAEEQLAGVKNKFRTPEDWQALLNSRHLTEKDMVRYYHNQMVTDKLIEKLGGQENFNRYIAELRSKANIKILKNDKNIKSL